MEHDGASVSEAHGAPGGMAVMSVSNPNAPSGQNSSVGAAAGQNAPTQNPQNGGAEMVQMQQFTPVYYSVA